MQTREQWKGSRNWTLVTGAATAATLSLGALAIAIPGDADAAPPSISLDERASVGANAIAGGFVPFDLGMFSGLHAPDQIVQDDAYFGDGLFWDTQRLSDGSRAGQARSVLAPPVTDGAAQAVSDGGPADDADEPTSVDVLSDEVTDAPAEASDDDVPDDAVTDGPTVTIADDPLSDDVSDDATDLVSDDAESIADDSFESIPDDPSDSIPDDSLDSPDDSD